MRTKQLQPDTILALRELVNDLEKRCSALQGFQGGSCRPADQRAQRYVCGERGHPADAEEPQSGFHARENAVLTNYKGQVDKATKFIPGWVKVAVALALGLGTMVGWKRIVVTVGEKIGKEHLTYAQGACAELVAMGTIMAADNFGLPVSDNARAELRRGGNHGGQQERIAVLDHSQYRGGVGVHAAGRGAAFRHAVLAVQAGVALVF